ncbi:MAG TPA: hypothetical protein H9735_00925 [Candidatus Anaerostipes excrementavium]|uniref:Uncharacterized protein n=1 Tax=Candidatus Anaerostipes excrementavium TaxID=2838463 RepID=A0A9D1WTL9_9FIRM|nr:hypothetical protein [uncultured Anaerostipes sp.]HIX66667.1 hypothetical protein [Candidatus Anaerostipes excrementavium]
MLIFFQRLWIFLFVDGFLLFLIVNLIRQKTESKEKIRIKPAKKVERRWGKKKLHFYFRDEHGKDLAGNFAQYPCTIGRGKSCDVRIMEEEKNGRYFLSREFIQVVETVDGFRVTRCRKKDEAQKTISGRSDGKIFENEISITFEDLLEIQIVPGIILRLEKEKLRTSAL